MCQSESETNLLESGFFMVLFSPLCLSSNCFAYWVAQTVRIANSRMAAPKHICDVLRELEARCVWDTALSTTIQVAHLADTSAVGQASKLRQAIIALK